MGLYLTSGNPGSPPWAQVSPSKWLMAGSSLPHLNGLLLIEVLCLALPVPMAAGCTAVGPTPLPILPVWPRWHRQAGGSGSRKSVLASCDTMGQREKVSYCLSYWPFQ